jgi:hypothetical protein
MSASVLCVSVCPTGEVFFLLGKQARAHSGRRTRVSDTWCDFGGHAAPADGASLAATAAREFWEESMCCVDVGLGDFGASGGPMRERCAALARSLHAGNYLAAVTVGGAAKASEASTTPSLDRGHVCYVRPVPWDPAAPRTFDSLRATLRHIRKTSKTLTWMVRRRPEGPRLHLLEQWAHTHAPPRTQVTAVSAVSLTEVAVVWPGGGATRTLPPGLTRDDVANYRAYLALAHTMHRMWERLPPHWRRHPAIKCTWWRGRVIRMTVPRHFLEMQCIAWWGLPALEALVRRMGRHAGAVVRPCFMPTVRVVLDYLAAQHGTHATLLARAPPVEKRRLYNNLLDQVSAAAARSLGAPRTGTAAGGTPSPGSALGSAPDPVDSPYPVDSPCAPLPPVDCAPPHGAPPAAHKTTLPSRQ